MKREIITYLRNDRVLLKFDVQLILESSKPLRAQARFVAIEDHQRVDENPDGFGQDELHVLDLYNVDLNNFRLARRNAEEQVKEVTYQASLEGVYTE
jgi:hypothetical protein